MSEFIQDEKIKSGLKMTGLLKGLWPFARKYPGAFLFAVSSMVISIVSARLLPAVIGWAVDHGILAKSAEALLQAALVYFVLEVFHSTFQFSYLYSFQRFGNRVLADLRLKLVGHVQKLPLEYFHKNPVGRIVTKLTNDPANLNEVFGEGLVNLIVNLGILFAIVVSMLLISWKLTLLTLLLSPLFLYLAIRISQVYRETLRDAKKQLSVVNSFASENLQGVRVLQVFAALEENQARFTAQSENYKNHVLSNIRTYAYLQPVMNIFTAFVVSTAVAGGAYFHVHEGLALGALVAFLLHSQDFIPPLREILEKYQQFQNSLTSGERVFQLFDEREEDVVTANLHQIGRGKIEIRNLSFRYTDSSPGCSTKCL